MPDLPDACDDLLVAAERALHRRRAAASEAARRAGVVDEVTSLAVDGLLVTATSSDALPFLRQVNGVTPGTVDALPDVLARLGELAADTTVTVATSHVEQLAPRLAALGLVDVGARPVAVTPLPLVGTALRRDDPGVVEVRAVTTAREHATFVDHLVAGYAADPAGRGEPAAFLRAEHEQLALTCTLATLDGTVAGAAARSRHDGVVVLGGASTLVSARGRGVQAALLAERLASATAEGADLAVTTAVDGSSSLRNLVRAGLGVIARRGYERRVRRTIIRRRVGRR